MQDGTRVNQVDQLNSFRLIACPHILSVEKDRIDVTRPPGGTVADIMRSIGWTHDRVHARVFLDGVLVKDAAWEYTRPCAGQSLVVRAVPMGGGGGKDVTRMVAMVAIVAASIAIANPELAVFGALASGVGGTAGAWAGAAAAATSIIGTLAVSARIPPPLPRCDQREVPHA